MTQEPTPWFVRAVVMDAAVLDDVPAPMSDPRGSMSDPRVEALAVARRHGLFVVLVSPDRLEELHRSGPVPLEAFDAVVAESGAITRVGGGAAHRRSGAAPASRRAAVLDVLAELGVSAHDALSISLDGGDLQRETLLEVGLAVDSRPRSPAVAPEERAEVAVDPGPGYDPGHAAQALVAEVLHGRAATPVPSPPVTVGMIGRRRDRGLCGVPAAHANVVVHAQETSTEPLQLLRRWVGAGYTCVVIDLADRYSEITLTEGAAAGTNVDPAVDPAVDAVVDPGVPKRAATSTGVSVVNGADQPAEAMREHLTDPHGLHVVQFPAAGSSARSAAIATTLSVLKTQRERTGQPHWLIIDDAESVLSDTALPPDALDLHCRGHCLVLRSPREIPGALARSIDVVVGDRREPDDGSTVG